MAATIRGLGQHTPSLLDADKYPRTQLRSSSLRDVCCIARSVLCRSSRGIFAPNNPTCHIAVTTLTCIGNRLNNAVQHPGKDINVLTFFKEVLADAPCGSSDYLAMCRAPASRYSKCTGHADTSGLRAGAITLAAEGIPTSLIKLSKRTRGIMLHPILKLRMPSVKHNWR